MAESTQLELLYRGVDVDNGTVPVDYMVDALIGFSGAYSKVARNRSGAAAHQIRLVGLRQGSAKIVLDVLEFVRANPVASGVLATVGLTATKGAYTFVKDLAQVIMAKKHLAGSPVPQVTFSGPTMIFQNQSGVPFELTKEQLEFLQSGTLDAELDKLTAPLEEGRVDEFELRVNEEQLAKIEASERRFFIHSVHEVTSTKDNIWMEGTLNSLSKTGYRGTFHTVSGKHIPYVYVGDNPQPLLDAFAFQGPVRVKCNVKFDEDLDPMRIDILTVEARQPPLFSKQ